MGISQQIGASSLSKPGVCTSSTRPATPYEGQQIYETDTDKVLVWNGTAWLYLATPQTLEIGASNSFTPSITNLTIGNGTRTGTYVQINKTVYFQAKITFGSTTTLTANADLTLPIAATGVTTFDKINVSGNFINNSPTEIIDVNHIMIGTTAIRLLAVVTSGTYALSADTSATVPFTWTTSDVITISGNYQVA